MNEIKAKGPNKASIVGNSRWCVYTLLLEGSEEVRYVGQTTKTAESRFGQHLKALREERYSQIPLYKWLKKHKNEVKCVVIGSVEPGDRKALDDLEIYWIDYFKINGNRLLNVMHGDEIRQREWKEKWTKSKKEKLNNYPELPYKVDLSGKVFGSWTVLSYDVQSNKVKEPNRWVCRCTCGVEKSVLGKSLNSGESTKCRECSVLGLRGHRSTEPCFVDGCIKIGSNVAMCRKHHNLLSAYIRVRGGKISDFTEQERRILVDKIKMDSSSRKSISFSMQELKDSLQNSEQYVLQSPLCAKPRRKVSKE